MARAHPLPANMRRQRRDVNRVVGNRDAIVTTPVAYWLLATCVYRGTRSLRTGCPTELCETVDHRISRMACRAAVWPM